jgi:hypothetical protein
LDGAAERYRDEFGMGAKESYVAAFEGIAYYVQYRAAAGNAAISGLALIEGLEGEEGSDRARLLENIQTNRDLYEGLLESAEDGNITVGSNNQVAALDGRSQEAAAEIFFEQADMLSWEEAVGISPELLAEMEQTAAKGTK